MYAHFTRFSYRESSVNYQELHHTDQVTLIVEEIKQRITYGSKLMNLCQCPTSPAIRVDGKNADSQFETVEDMNILYGLWTEL